MSTKRRTRYQYHNTANGKQYVIFAHLGIVIMVHKTEDNIYFAETRGYGDKPFGGKHIFELSQNDDRYHYDFRPTRKAAVDSVFSDFVDNYTPEAPAQEPCRVILHPADGDPKVRRLGLPVDDTTPVKHFVFDNRLWVFQDYHFDGANNVPTYHEVKGVPSVHSC